MRDSKPTTKPAKTMTEKHWDGLSVDYELHPTTHGFFELWANYGEWVLVGYASSLEGMGAAIAVHDAELKAMPDELGG